MSAPNKRPKQVSRSLDKLLRELSILFGMQNYDRHFYIEEKDNENNGKKRAADIEILEDYQRIYVSLYPCFFKVSLGVQRTYLLHEFCHYLTHEVHYCADELLDGKLITREQLRVANEKSVSRATNLVEMILLGDAKKEAATYRGFTRR